MKKTLVNLDTDEREDSDSPFEEESGDEDDQDTYQEEEILQEEDENEDEDEDVIEVRHAPSKGLRQMTHAVSVFQVSEEEPLLVLNKGKSKASKTNSQLRNAAQASGSKRKTSSTRTQSAAASTSKRPRLQQPAKSAPLTPNTRSQLDQAIPGTGTTTRTATEAGTELDTSTPSGDNETSIWLYYISKPGTRKALNKAGECRGCGKIVKGQSTSKLNSIKKSVPA